MCLNDIFYLLNSEKLQLSIKQSGTEISSQSGVLAGIFRSLHHHNVAVFIGCLLDMKKPAFIYEYCFRGTLKKLLEDSEVDLDWIFKLSFLLDIAEGMRYLHSRKVVHGRLSTACCLINDQWSVKIQGMRL